MAFEKTMMGNPTGPEAEKPKAPEIKHFGVPYRPTAEALKETPEQLARRMESAREAEEEIMKSVREKITKNPVPEQPKDPDAWRKGTVIMSPEETAALLANVDKRPKAKPTFFGRIGRFFGGK